MPDDNHPTINSSMSNNFHGQDVFEKRQPEKNRSDNKLAAPEASVHPFRNRLCYHFSLYQMNESCSESVSRRLMLLISFNVTETERPFHERFQR